MAVMAADSALGLGVRFVARRFSDVSPTDEGFFIFSVLEFQLQTPDCDRDNRVFWAVHSYQPDRGTFWHL